MWFFQNLYSHDPFSLTALATASFCPKDTHSKLKETRLAPQPPVAFPSFGHFPALCLSSLKAPSCEPGQSCLALC